MQQQNWKRRARRRAVAFVIATCAAALPVFEAVAGDVNANDVLTYAGVARVGDFAQPQGGRLADQVFTDEVIRSLDHAVRTALAQQPTGLVIETDKLAELQPGRPAYALALGLVDVEVLKERIGEEDKRTYRVDARVLVFDFREMAVVYQRPVLLEFIDVGRSADDVATLQAVAQGRRTDGLAAGFMAALGRALLPSHRRCTFQVGAASASNDGVMAAFTGGDPDRVRRLPNQLADGFQDYMAAEAGLSFVPSRLDQLVGGAMASRFADGRVYTFAIPDPDYAVSLALVDTRKVEAVSRPGYRTLVYGVYLDVKIAEPLSGAVLFEDRLKQGAPKVAPASQAVVDDREAYAETLRLLLQDFASQVRTPDDAWMTAHATRNPQEASRQLKSLRDRCATT